MRIGVISDIHANLYSLMEVYSKLEREGVDSVVCLGDIVGYGPHPNEVINFIKRKQLMCVKGVYDSAVVNSDFSHINENTINNFSIEFTKEELTKNNIYYLSNLPSEIVVKFDNFKVKFIHRNPYEDLNFIEEDILVCGYEHTPQNIKIGKGKYVLSPGSVGRPSASINGVSFGILEILNSTHKFDIVTCEHSFSKIYKDMKMMNFPEILINSYDIGDS